MSFLIKQNIFSEIKGKSLQVNNIKSFFGDRVIDILTQTPLNFLRKNLREKLEIPDINKIITIDVKIINHIRPHNKKSPYKVIAVNKVDQKINILFFGSYKKFIVNKLIINQEYRITGKLYFFGEIFQLIHPTEIIKESDLNLFEKEEPIYNLARKKINKKLFRKLVLKSLEILKVFTPPSEWIKTEIKNIYKWNDFKSSLIQIHQPNLGFNESQFNLSRKRLAFDEVLSNFLIFNELKKKPKQQNNFMINNFSLSKSLIKNLDFKLTIDQEKTLEEIKKELINKRKVYRLIQGDVGSGKTIVSLLIIADFLNSGYQCVLMAPTELLAKQHFDYFTSFLKNSKFNIEIFTGKTTNKKKILENVATNHINLLIGTHAVYNKSLKFKNLGLVVIDEQHKFGVNQRIKLLEKSINCHTIIMSATPIPRSLSFALYGEIDISMIKTKPKGRKKVITSIISNKKIKDLIDGIKRKINKGEQVFWILPNIGDNADGFENETVLTRYEMVKNIFRETVGIIHGRMNDKDIKKTMEEFKQKEKMILISTTMIEVGINIPNATLIIIEEANKFGLAQLHQLRGRISRSNLPANCILLHNHNLSENAVKRLLILKNSNDGFEIAEKDMFLRGSGDFFGTNQSGITNWRFFEPYTDIDMIDKVKENFYYLLKDKHKNINKIQFLINTFYGRKEYLNYFSA